MTTYQIRVKEERGGQTLLSFLRDHLDDYPSVKALKRSIDQKLCTINGRVEFFSTHPVKRGDQIEITLAERAQGKKRDSFFPLIPLFEDGELIIINKPSGRGSETFEGKYYLVHRLDKGTSGALVLAKTAKMQKALISLFSAKEVNKGYLALCDKMCRKREWTVRNELGRKASYQGGVIYGKVANGGKKALTHFRCLKTCEEASLIFCRPITGRTHQIRVHLKGCGHPVLGDWQYHPLFICTTRPPRLMLHALSIGFVHPTSGKTVEIRAPLPDDFFQLNNTLFHTRDQIEDGVGDRKSMIPGISLEEFVLLGT